MLLTGDYHTHTIYSHGSGTVMDNAVAAKELGLKEIAITDHGFEQMAFGIKRKKVPQLIADCKEATAKTGVKVYVGMEANLCDEDGRTDMTANDYKDFDIFLMGIHRFVKFTRFKDFWNMFFVNAFYTMLKKEGSKRLIRYNTRAYINSIERYPIDAITHLNFLCFCDVAEVSKAARDCGTYIELNAKKVHLSDEQLEKVVATGVRFIIDSDAHSPDRVGDTKIVDDILSRVDVPRERIDNIDGRYPDFRFRAFKEKSL